MPQQCQPGAPTNEACDELDNDCDGSGYGRLGARERGSEREGERGGFGALGLTRNEGSA